MFEYFIWVYVVTAVLLLSSIALYRKRKGPIELGFYAQMIIISLLPIINTLALGFGLFHQVIEHDIWKRKL